MTVMRKLLTAAAIIVLPLAVIAAAARLQAQSAPPRTSAPASPSATETPAAPRPDPATLSAFASTVEQALDTSAAQHPNPGSPIAHRLNRAEYANAIRDLFGLTVEIRTLLPADDSGFGFDNIGDVLNVSS